MIRTQVQLRKDQHERIRTLAHRSRISFAETLRRLIDTAMDHNDGNGQTTGAQALLQIAGTGRSGLGDLGRRHDDYLDEDLAK